MQKMKILNGRGNDCVRQNRQSCYKVMLHSNCSYSQDGNIQQVSQSVGLTVSRQVHHSGPVSDISTTTKWIVVQFYTGIYSPHRMKSTDFGDLLTSPATSRLTEVVFQCDAFTTIGQIAMKYGTHIHAQLRMNCNHFGGTLWYLANHLHVRCVNVNILAC